mgnify:CR=1 FL=1
MRQKTLFLKLRSSILLMGTLLVLSANTQAQTRIINGIVTDSSGAGIPGVTVKIKDATGGTMTTKNGNFTISVPSSQSVLIFSSIGYVTKEISVGSETVSNVVLARSNEVLSDIVMVGYLQQSKIKTSAAISKLNPEELVNTSNPNPIQAIQGKIAGVSVPITSGQPGQGATNILIRGGTKLNVYGTSNGNSGGAPVSGTNASSPLVIIDGVFRSLDDINPDNIASFQVMKDAAATAIYGARGANGVIVVTTKSGKFNSKPVLSLNHRTTWETNARFYNYLNAEQYLKLARTTVKDTYDPLPKSNLLDNGGFSAGTRVFTNKGDYGNNVYTTAFYDNIVAVEGQKYVDNLLSKGWQTMDDPINPGTKLLFNDNHYQDLLWNTGISSNDNISLSGGGENIDYNVSLGYTNQMGTFIGTKYQRYDALGNFNIKVSKNFKLEAMLNYQNVLPNYVEAYNNELTRGTRLTPLIRIFKDNGDPAPGEVFSARNRLHTLKYDDTRVNTENFVSRLAGDLTIAKGLHFKPSVSYFMQDYRYLFFRKKTPSSEIQPSTQRQKNENTDNMRQLMVDHILQYDFTLKDDHHFTLLAGFNYTRLTNSIVSIGSKNAANDYIYTINEPSTGIANGAVVTNVTNFHTELNETRSASYFGQLNYDFKNKYLVSAALRDDGFSNFAPENKYALFPSASVGWNVNKENFWHVKSISSLKLRASWGQAGSSDLDITDTYGGYSAYTYAQGSGILRTNLSNPNLRWEATQTTDLAFDAGFFEDRLTLSADFYNKLTMDRLASKPLPSESPFSSITYNNGTLQNKGVEIALGATIFGNKLFTWRTNFSFAYNHQLITKLPDDGRLKNRQGGDIIYDPKTKQNIEAGGFAEGERPYSIYAYKVLGVFSTEAESAAWNTTHKDQLASAVGIPIGKHAGDFIFDDVNNDGVIDSKDQVFMGYRTPDKIGGMQNYLTYKSFSLKIAMDYALGHIIENGALARSLGTGRAFNEGAPSEALGPDIWQKEGDVGKKYARFSFADFDYGQRNYIRNATLGTNNSYGSDVSAMISKGDFLAFREISLSYEFPSQVIKKIHATGLNVYFGVYNLGYLTRYKGFNPETYTGYDDGGYPRPRQYSIGGTLRF